MLRDPNMKEIRTALSEDEFIDLIQTVPFLSVIGHHDLADALTMICDMDIPYNRQAIRVVYDDIILLESVEGRLPLHPRLIEYKGRLNYSIVRFEKQTADDLANTLAKIQEIKEAV